MNLCLSRLGLVVLILSTGPFGGCGGDVQVDSGRSASGAGPTGAGLVQCGAETCDVESGNQCYLCDKGSGHTCHTLDLPAECDFPVWFWCDGDEDCEPGETCVEQCAGDGDCSVPGRGCV